MLSTMSFGLSSLENSGLQRSKKKDNKQSDFFMIFLSIVFVGL